MNKKFLWCKKCKKYPDKIKERYREPLIEFRKWNGFDYELQDSNISEIEFEQFCGVCGSKLIEK
ncbi:MAG: hypothetical protein ACTSUF_03380 [Candidatus Heimdallarchaeaceae archaeon]